MSGESALSEKLRAALDRAEETARIYEGGKEDWRVTDDGGLADGNSYMLLWGRQVEGMLGSRRLAHIAANSPAHVLRTVAAHRKILDEYEAVRDDTPQDLEQQGAHAQMLIVVRLLAAVYFPEAPDGT